MKNKLSRYSAAALATVTGGAAYGQTQYTDFNPDLVASGNQDTILVDVNGDLVNDFGFATTDTVLGGADLGIAQVFPVGTVGNLIAGSSPVSYNYAFRLSPGEQIDSLKAFLPEDSSGYMAFTVNGNSPYNEPWNGGVTDGFVGFALQLNGETHYGWMRCDVSADAKTITVKDAAYNLTPGEAVGAGEQISVDELLRSRVKLVNAGGKVKLEVPVELTGYTLRLTDMAGREIMHTGVEETVYSLPANGFPAGSYVLSFELDGKGFREKVTLY